jgi:hypothetical protein
MLSESLSCSVPCNICHFSRVKFVKNSITYKKDVNEIKKGGGLTGEDHEIVVALNFECFDVRVCHYNSWITSIFNFFGFDVTKSPRN